MKSRTQLAAKYGRQEVSILPDYLTPDEVASLLRVTVRTLRKWRAAGTGPRFIKHGATVRYLKSELNC
jgi:excisionase family DNA binding protein